MGSKQKSKTVDAVPILEIPNFKDMKYVWCGKCKHVYSTEAWASNNNICPSKKCFGTKGLPWDLLRSFHETYPKVPEVGKFYHQ